MSEPRSGEESALASSSSSPVKKNTRKDTDDADSIIDRTTQSEEQQQHQSREKNETEASAAVLLASWSNSPSASASQPNRKNKQEEEQGEGKGNTIGERKDASSIERDIKESSTSPNPSSTPSSSERKSSVASSSSNSSSSLDENDVAPSALPPYASASKAIGRDTSSRKPSSTDRAEVEIGQPVSFVPTSASNTPLAGSDEEQNTIGISNDVGNRTNKSRSAAIKKRKVVESSKSAVESTATAQDSIDTCDANDKVKIDASTTLSTATDSIATGGRSTRCSKAPIKKRKKLDDDLQNDSAPAAPANAKNVGNVNLIDGKSNDDSGWLKEFYTLMTTLTKLVDTKLDGDPTLTIQQVEQLAQTEFNLLTATQREQLCWDIYGKRDQQEAASDHFVMQDSAAQGILIQQMEQRIAEHYHLQQQKHPSVPIPATHVAACSSPNFRSTFLQATGNDLQMSTQQLLSYIAARSSLFDEGVANTIETTAPTAAALTAGANKNYDNINYFIDLSDNDRKLLHTGYIQFSPGLRDKSKRLILFLHERFFTSSHDWNTRVSLLVSDGSSQ